MSVPGIGPLISTAVVAAVGTGEAFECGHDFGACLVSYHASTAQVADPSSAASPSAGASIAHSWKRSLRQTESYQ